MDYKTLAWYVFTFKLLGLFIISVYLCSSYLSERGLITIFVGKY